ncbi:MAG: AfsR/SARP family transcriptional regulator [Streptomyces sp.]|uniref:AfsR/SARP family transcriptional regulator n=1 Tax=Streptomyces sp. TaxID=1931 RepID=UPI0025F88812|nr:AfsR/SARP family transcriptional regulator [Streptomyces sp.]MBW8792486.1 AfsR/SARP family transcriptional regulator [Streptomyces sp.]
MAQQILLLALLLSPAGLVTSEALKYELWGDSWPENSENSLHAHVSRLRRQLRELEPDRDIPRLLSEHTSYQLLFRDEEVDGWRFRATVWELQKRADEMPPELIAASVRSALADWRGPVFGGTVGGSICRVGGRALEQLRYEALELLFRAELRCGNHARIVPELVPLVTTYTPFLQRFSEQLMIALYRSGRQVEALQAYQQVKNILVAHGDAPGDRLRKCEQAVLTQNSVLVSASAALHAA